MNGNIITQIPKDTNSNITLIAKWQEKELKITYRLDGGKLDTNINSFTVSNIPNLPTPTKKGYKFIGWSLDNEIIEKIPDNTTTNITLTATWEKSSNCSQSSFIQFIILTNILSYVIIIFRKKH